MSKRRKYTSEMKYHYTYRITNIKDRMYYYGVRSCNCLPKEDIGVKYFSSSKNKFVKDQKENSQDYKYKVLKIFSTRKEAVEHEIFLHNKFNVKLHEQFYNNANQTSTGFDTSGTSYSHTEETKQKMSLERKGAGNSMFGKKHTDEAKQKMRDNNKHMFGSDNAWHKSNRTEKELKERAQNVAESRKLNGTYSLEYNGMYGKNHTDESKQKMKDTIKENGGRSGENNSFYGKTHTEKTKSVISQANTGRIKTQEEIEKARASNTGKKRTEETCNNISKALSGKPQKKVECPYCNKVGGASSMTRFHFDNCKDFKIN